MKRLIILYIAYPLSIISSPSWWCWPCCSRPEQTGMRIEVLLYKRQGSESIDISKDFQDYYRNKQDSYDRGAASATSAHDTNRITIDSVTFDSQQQLAKIIYYVRLGKGASANKGSAEVKFGKSSIQAWDADKEIKFSSTYISANI